MAKKKASKKTAKKKAVRKSAVRKTPRDQALPGIGEDPVNAKIEELAMNVADAKASIRSDNEEIKKVMRKHGKTIYRRGRFVVHLKQGAETVTVSVKPEKRSKLEPAPF